MLNSLEFLLPEIPSIHPLSQDYITFWREQKRRCIEGHWVSGFYMPGALYFYVNFATIRRNKPGSATKSLLRPLLRDLEWTIFRDFLIVRGFSGFKDDPTYSCDHSLLELEISDKYLATYRPHLLQASGQRKVYQTPHEYLAKQHSNHYTEPLYENPLKNFLMLGSRGLGKSYVIGAGLIPHAFLFDGAINYNEDSIKSPTPIEVLVGSVDSSKSADTLRKTRDTFDLLPGKQIINNRIYPSPFFKRTTGSWEVNAEIRAEYKKKVEGGWVVMGSKSNIKHRSFSNNSFAAQGTRPLILALDEIGLMENAKDIHANTVDNLRDGLVKTGSLFMIGTGGQMEGGTTAVQEMFYEPEKYDILSYQDNWEMRGRIGLFIPAYLALNEYKDEQGNTDVEAATKDLLKVRETKKGKTGGSDALNKEIIYRPLVPSEMFLQKTANVFPTAELRNRLTALQNQHDLSFAVDLYFDPTAQQGVGYKINPTLDPIKTFPYDGDNREGAVVIYELPKVIDGVVPSDAYLIGCDPYKDDSQSGQSLASIYVVKTSAHSNTIGHDEIVASYIGRPYMGKNQVNEILFKLSLFYGNAKIYFENNVGNVKDYFEKNKRLDLLALQPTNIFNKKASFVTNQPLIYGYTMSNDKVKWESLQYLRSWLLESRGDNMKNLDLISDPGLLQELIMFNMKGNFDRVMSFIGVVLGLEETFIKRKRKIENKEVNSLIDQEFIKFIASNKRLFNESVSKTTPLF